ncbi:MAG: hypothetical protein K6F37_08415 [Lachnospiraceae bacterium]|nr:hypothetical protein [Lachnospiraceae bacterium]
MTQNHDLSEFNRWLEKSKGTELDIINCRKMQSVSLVERKNAFGIYTVAVCGFVNNDMVKLGGDIVQRYDESLEDFYKRAYRILLICSELMDAVNEVLVDTGSWGAHYFQDKLNEWFKEKINTEIIYSDKSMIPS